MYVRYPCNPRSWGTQVVLIPITGCSIPVYHPDDLVDRPRAMGVWIPFFREPYTYLPTQVVLIPITGCSINPTRSFGPSLVANSWDHHWIWCPPLDTTLRQIAPPKSGRVQECYLIQVAF